ncbi:MAG: hypothetical protein M1G31_01275 [Pseudanabaena sp. Salubria-1]|nr:hypothetical protein [Pseudanabaena sp. Salubria-1]
MIAITVSRDLCGDRFNVLNRLLLRIIGRWMPAATNPETTRTLNSTIIMTLIVHNSHRKLARSRMR